MTGRRRRRRRRRRRLHISIHFSVAVYASYFMCTIGTTTCMYLGIFCMNARNLLVQWSVFKTVIREPRLGVRIMPEDDGRQVTYLCQYYFKAHSWIAVILISFQILKMLIYFYYVSNFIISILHVILLAWSNQRAWDTGTCDWSEGN
jgi:hypothetical protein